MKAKSKQAIKPRHTQMPPKLKSGALNGKDRNMCRKKKKVAYRTHKRNAWQIFSRFIRLRDCLFTTGTKEYGKCITCGIQFPFEKLQAGHFIAGRFNANLFSEEGVHAQCRTCNIIKSGNQLAYRRAIVELYGDGYDEVLEKEARQIKTFTSQQLIKLAEYYREEMAKLEAK